MKTREKNKYSKSKCKNPFRKTWDGVPATVRKSLFEVSLYESFFASLFWHFMGILLICLAIFAFNFFGITPKLFPKQKIHTKDIEFIIKNPSRHRIHYRKIKAKQSTQDLDKAPNNIEPNKLNSDISHINSENKNMKQTQNNTGVNKKNNIKSIFAPKSKSGATSKSNIPDFAIPMAKLKSMSSGLGNSSGGKHHATGFDASNSSINGVDNAFSSSKDSSDHSGFDKNTTRKMITPYDISPYVNELKRNIRWNWKAPKGNKRVELFLRIAKDGRLIILNVKRTSENGDVDNAALTAVKKSLPLNPLPTKYSKSYLDVIFTFDSNSISSRY